MADFPSRYQLRQAHLAAVAARDRAKRYPGLQVWNRAGQRGGSEPYCYHRPSGIRLMSVIGSSEFEAEYAAACLALAANNNRPVGRRRFVYFIQGEITRLVKIGISRNPARRLLHIRTDCSEPVDLVGVIDASDAAEMEASLHRRFADDRSHGEWFRPSQSLLDHIANEGRQTPFVKPAQVSEYKDEITGDGRRGGTPLTEEVQSPTLSNPARSP